MSPTHPAVDEDRLQRALAPHIARWQARADDEGLKPEKRAYARARAAKMKRPWGKRLADCARAGKLQRCGCKGARKVAWYTCRQHLMCRLCRKKRAKQMLHKTWQGLEAAQLAYPNRLVVLITLTLRPSGDIAADAKALMAGWRDYYRRNNRRWEAFPYVLVRELHKSGVQHLHVVALWPRGNDGDGSQGDWGLQRALWLEACPQSQRIHFAASRSPTRAANYVSKYVSKGVQTPDYSPQLRADIIAASYNAHWVATSKGFWPKFAPCCPSCGERFVPARYTFPHAHLSVAERLRLDGWSTRDGPSEGDSRQMALDLPEANERPGAHGFGWD